MAARPLSEGSTMRRRMAAPTSVALPGLLYWRIQRGITQAELAEKVAIRRASVARIEGGHPALVRTAGRLADALGVQVTDLQRQPPAD
jgi:transcriptional regulator with XRE-family HTH domain